MRPGERSQGVVPKKIEYEFEEMHIAMVWDELKERFGFNVKEWQKKFHRYLDEQPRQVDVVSAFYRFGNANINTLLNQILCRNSGFSTWNNLCAYVLKKKR